MSQQNPFFDVMPRRSFFVALSAFLILCFAMFAPVNMAQAAGKALDAPRAAGLVGERYDGYAVVRGNAPADIVELVASTNAQRKAVYTAEAAKQGASVIDIGKIYAAEIVKSAPAHTWFLSESGSWTQK